jgi:D-alanyl-D-alanine carboxypeptidase
VRAAQLLERGFGGGNGLSWLRPSMGSVENLAPIDANPPNLRDEMCNGKRKRPASDDDDGAMTVAAGGSASATGGEAAATFLTAGLQAPMPKASDMLNTNYPVGEPMVVYTGPKKSGPALIAAVATDSNQQTTRRGKRARVAAKPDAGAAEAKPKAEARQAAKPAATAAAKPKVQHASAKPDAAAKPAEKPAAAAPKPAKPAAAKPKPEAKPAG